MADLCQGGEYATWARVRMTYCLESGAGGGREGVAQHDRQMEGERRREGDVADSVGDSDEKWERESAEPGQDRGYPRAWRHTAACPGEARV